MIVKKEKNTYNPLTKYNIIDHIAECGKFLDSLPVATGKRYVWNPDTEEIEEIFVKGSGNFQDINDRIGNLQRFEIYRSNKLSK